MDRPFEIGGIAVDPGCQARVEVPAARLPTHTMLHLPVTIMNGKEDGARLWLSAALHGDELNGMEVIRQVLERVDPQSMRGLLLAVPVVNVFGFVNQSRYLPDRRDLNRSFPGSRTGSLASRLAALFMDVVVRHCTHGIDLHTAAPPRTNLPQIRGDLDDPETRRCAEAFGAPVMLKGKPPRGALRAAAARRGVAVLLYEAGEPLRFNREAIDVGVTGILAVMASLGMIDPAAAGSISRGASLEARRTKWLRAPQSGVLHLHAALGDRVADKQILGRITDPFGEAAKPVRAPFDSVVIGHTNHALVHRGDGIVHLAQIDTDPTRRAERGQE